MADYLMYRREKTLQEFLHLDSVYSILDYLILGYEQFHMTGDEGIAEEVEEFIRLQGGYNMRKSNDVSCFNCQRLHTRDGPASNL